MCLQHLVSTGHVHEHARRVSSTAPGPDEDGAESIATRTVYWWTEEYDHIERVHTLIVTPARIYTHAMVRAPVPIP